MVMEMIMILLVFFFLFLSLHFTGFISNISMHKKFFPDEEDQKGAAKALMRLQDTYQLDSESFSKGKLPGKRHRNLFSDIFLLTAGLTNMNYNKLKYTVLYGMISEYLNK